jgi:hypothetical protein
VSYFWTAVQKATAAAAIIIIIIIIIISKIVPVLF